MATLYPIHNAVLKDLWTGDVFVSFYPALLGERARQASALITQTLTSGEKKGVKNNRDQTKMLIKIKERDLKNQFKKQLFSSFLVSHYFMHFYSQPKCNH